MKPLSSRYADQTVANDALPIMSQVKQKVGATLASSNAKTHIRNRHAGHPHSNLEIP
ncbi:MAG: hypothetical protein WB607_17230 [Candidatus Acidiferrum sp.]